MFFCLVINLFSWREGNSFCIPFATPISVNSVLEVSKDKPYSAAILFNSFITIIYSKALATQKFTSSEYNTKSTNGHFSFTLINIVSTTIVKKYCDYKSPWGEPRLDFKFGIFVNHKFKFNFKLSNTFLYMCKKD